LFTGIDNPPGRKLQIVRKSNLQTICCTILTDTYQAAISTHNPSTSYLTLLISTANREYSVEVDSFRHPRRSVINRSIPLKSGEQITILTPEQHGQIFVDFLDFYLDSDSQVPRSSGDRTSGWEDLLRLMGLWQYSDFKYVFIEFLLLLPVISYALQSLSMFFFKNTLGCWAIKIRIVTAKSARKPHIGRMLLRLGGYLVSLLTLGTGLLFPITSPSTRNENLIDRFSGTVLIQSRRRP
jgi:hypothetical protein